MKWATHIIFAFLICLHLDSLNQNTLESSPFIISMKTEQVSSWSLGGPGGSWQGWFWWETPTQVLWMVCESLMRIGHVEGHQDSARPPSPFLESWRTWRFLTGLILVWDPPHKPSEWSVKVWWGLAMWKGIKTLPVLQVPSWSLGGHGGSWQGWFWWETLHTSHLNGLWKFEEDWPCGRASRLCPSSKSPPGVLEDLEVPDWILNGLIGLWGHPY